MAQVKTYILPDSLPHKGPGTGRDWNKDAHRHRHTHTHTHTHAHTHTHLSNCQWKGLTCHKETMGLLLHIIWPELCLPDRLDLLRAPLRFLSTTLSVLSVCLSVCLSVLSVCLSLCLVCLSVCLSVHLSTPFIFVFFSSFFYCAHLPLC